jgi:hypothetical protein
MRAGGDLGHDAAIRRMAFDLGADDVGADGARIVDDRRGGLVAARFDAEDDHAPPVPLSSVSPAGLRGRAGFDCFRLVIAFSGRLNLERFAAKRRRPFIRGSSALLVRGSERDGI